MFAARLALLAAALPLRAQPPAIAQNGVVNAASQMPPPLAAGSLARGALIHIHGVRLADPPKPVAVTIRSGVEAIPLTIVSASPRRIEALVPPTAPLGEAQLQVAAGGAVSSGFPVRIVAANAALFSRSGKGWGPALAENVDPSGRAPNTFANPVPPGGRIALILTGAGNSKPRVFAGGLEARADLDSKPLSPGRHQVLVTLPGVTPTGCFVPVHLLTAGYVSNVVTIAVGPAGEPCRDASSMGISGPRLGMVVLSRSFLTEAGTGVLFDEGAAFFVEAAAGPAIAPLLMAPPPGACAFFTGSYQAGIAVPRSLTSAIIDDVGGRGLRAEGRLVIGNGTAERAISSPAGTPGFFLGRLGGDGGPGPRRPPFFAGGDVSVRFTGGGDAPAFQLRLPAPVPFDWVDQAALRVVDRSRPLRLSWKGIPRDHAVLILAMNVDPASTALGMCVCSARAADNRFTVPPPMLANLPSGAGDAAYPLNVVYLVAIKRLPLPLAGWPRESTAAVALSSRAAVVEYR